MIHSEIHENMRINHNEYNREYNILIEQIYLKKIIESTYLFPIISDSRSTWKTTKGIIEYIPSKRTWKERIKRWLSIWV